MSENSRGFSEEQDEHSRVPRTLSRKSDSRTTKQKMLTLVSGVCGYFKMASFSNGLSSYKNKAIGLGARGFRFLVAFLGGFNLFSF